MDKYKGSAKGHIQAVGDDLERELLRAVPAQNIAFLYVLKKSERLAGALGAIARLIGQGDPLARSLQRCSLLILHLCLLLKAPTPARSPEEKRERLLYRVSEILSLLSVARMSGVLSEMNCAILQQEYIQLSRAIAEVGRGEEEDELRGTLGSVDVLLRNYEEESALVSKNTPALSTTQKGTGGPFSRIRSRSNYKGHTPAPATETRRVGYGSHGAKGQSQDRREAILDIIRKKETVGIKDIAAQITDCSEKTIQRELLALVSEGVLKKEGERRWSTYSLAA